ncbi:hypothetical protein TNCT_385051 [Trichonephila clavata]|uniref:Uncharacterized protein n=1 Tax=Trichonephila clavata TaxID=2740835 RepID=A0A8X6GHM7_TRICU|nr:hypothetical protein TNCT_432911 [Trichonephila clavata]GFR30561.1 hypothetical protein TNCT_385051 [Trichonephila clavata]
MRVEGYERLSACINLITLGISSILRKPDSHGYKKKTSIPYKLNPLERIFFPGAKKKRVAISKVKAQEGLMCFFWIPLTSTQKKF